MLNGWGVWTFANVDSLERLAADGDEVGAAGLQGFLGLLRGEDQPDRHRPDACFLAHALGEGKLEPGHPLQRAIRDDLSA